MVITQTVEIPASRRLNIEVPPEVPEGLVVLTFTPAPEAADLPPCPLCAENIDPETGNPRYNSETIAAMKEGRAIMLGENPAKWYNNAADMLAALKNGSEDGADD